MLDRWRPLWALLLVVGGGSSWQMDPRRVEEALNRSVFAYDGRNGGKPTAEWDEGDVGRSARRFLRSYLWDPLSSVLILDGKMIVDKRFLEGNNNKCKKHAGFVVSMLAEFHTSSASGKRGLPNSAYKFSTSSIGEEKGKEREPWFVMAKDTIDRAGVLIPNPYFEMMTDWHWYRSHLHAVANERPFDRRRKAAFWRGAIRNRADPKRRANQCKFDLGNYARLKAASLSVSDPDLVNVKCAGLAKCEPRDDPDFCDGVADAPPMPYDTEAMVRAAKRPKLISDEEWTMQDDFSRHKYVLNLPGSTHGSYSRNLNHLWSLGSVVLQWATRAVEWYYPALVDGENYVVVDGESLVPTVKRLQADPAEAHRLVQGARHVDKAFLCAECIADHFRRALEAVRDHWREDLVLDDPCALQAFLEDDETAAALGCDDLDLVEIVASYTNGLVSNVESWQNSYDKWTNPTPGRFKNMFHHSRMPREDKSAYGGWTHAVLDAKPLRGSGSSCARLANHARKRCPRAPEED